MHKASSVCGYGCGAFAILSWVIFACAAALPRLKHLEAVLVPCEWLAAGQFTVADILMTNVLRLPKAMSAGDFPAIRSYVDQAYAHPALKEPTTARRISSATSPFHPAYTDPLPRPLPLGHGRMECCGS